MTPDQRPRAVFSIQDFRLIRQALAHYLATANDEAESHKFASLYHRLGRVDDSPISSAGQPAAQGSDA